MYQSQDLSGAVSPVVLSLFLCLHIPIVLLCAFRPIGRACGRQRTTQGSAALGDRSTQLALVFIHEKQQMTPRAVLFSRRTISL